MENLLRDLSSECNIYKYPSGEDCPFIIPATKAEHEGHIKVFKMGREPKFEPVYDQYSKIPTIQFDIETDLMRVEMEKLLPHPYGVSFPELADYFRTVYASHPWEGIDIRFDLRFKNTEEAGIGKQVSGW